MELRIAIGIARQFGSSDDTPPCQCSFNQTQLENAAEPVHVRPRVARRIAMAIGRPLVSSAHPMTKRPARTRTDLRQTPNAAEHMYVRRCNSGRIASVIVPVRRLEASDDATPCPHSNNQLQPEKRGRPRACDALHRSTNCE